MKKIVLREHEKLIGKSFGEDVIIVMDWNSSVVGCTFYCNVVIRVTDDVRNAVGSALEWLQFPMFVNNQVWGKLTCDKHVIVSHNTVLGLKKLSKVIR